MAIKPKIVTLTNNSPDVLNAIRNSASIDYRNYVPIATADADSVKEIGKVIMDYPALQNEFLNALVNRIAFVVIQSKAYKNPWAMFKKGVIENGETIESIFVELAKPFEYDPAMAETQLFKREKPDVRSAFHVVNYKKFYKTTIEREELGMAFLSWAGVTDLIAKIVDAIYTASEYDEFQVMKYMLARHILLGQMNPVQVKDSNDSANAKDIVATLKKASNAITFMNNKYTLAGVRTHTLKDDQYLIVDARFDATMDVEVLATAFNMEKAEFMGKRVLIDGFGEIDNERLAELFADDETYVELTPAQLTALNTIPAVLIDKDWFMIYDRLAMFDEQRNAQGLYWNYFYHVWKTFSVSPFAQCIAFVPGAPGVTSVDVSPATAGVTVYNTATHKANATLSLQATVATTYYASQAVDWTITAGADNGETGDALITYATIDRAGLLTVYKEAPNNLSITVKATSVVDGTKSDTATVTVTKVTA